MATNADVFECKINFSKDNYDRKKNKARPLSGLITWMYFVKMFDLLQSKVSFENFTHN